MAQTSFALVMPAIAGGMALLRTVAQRRHEVGVRIALGAPAAAVKAMFLRRGLLLSGVGIALGLTAASGLSRMMSLQLFGVAPHDPATYGDGGDPAGGGDGCHIHSRAPHSPSGSYEYGSRRV
jgi:putative ABC transport system permease protein